MASPPETVRCPRCGTENREGAAFCAGCDALLAGHCAHCLAELPAGARFCSTCGLPVEPAAGGAVELPPPARGLSRLKSEDYVQPPAGASAAPSPERRLVTILFCDVKGSTAMAEKLDPEDFLDVMNGAFEVLIPPVHRHEGTVARLLGDAILAFFGAPVAHEDDPERAIRAALEMLAAAREYAGHLAREQGILGFNVRVGINTGLVVVGEVGSDRYMEHTAMGDGVNLAARMEQAAEPGTLLITAATHRQVRGLFECEPQAPLTVKGKSEPVSTFRVVAARPRVFRSPTRGLEGIETQMVGRDAEMKALQDAFLTLANGGESKFITVIADAGLGKSRLLFEFGRWLEAQPAPARLLRARAGQDLQGVPYGLFRSMFALYLGIGDGDPAAEVCQRFEEAFAAMLGQAEESRMKAHFVARLVGYDLPHSAYASEMARDPQQMRDRAVFYLTQFFASAAAAGAGAGASVLFLEDIHWADDSSLDLLGRLARDLSDRSWLIVATARPVLDERRPRWVQGMPGQIRMQLKPLSPRASQEMVDNILQRLDDAPDVLAQLITGGAEGNPYYLEELVKMLIDDGTIIADADRWRVEPGRLAATSVPSSLTGLLQARLDRLPLAERGTLQQASVIGRVFWDLAVAHMLAHTPGTGAAIDLPAALGELRRREMIFRRGRSSFQGPREYVFKHALLRQVAYEGIARRLRQHYHSLTADWLLAQAGDRAAEHAALIAEHLGLAGRKAEACVYLQTAAERAAARYANEEAMQTYRRLLALRETLPTDSPGETIAVLYERLGDLFLWLTRHAEAGEAYDQARARPEAQARLTQARLLRKTANALRDHSDFEGALRVYAETESTLGAPPEAPGPGAPGASAAVLEWWREWIEVRIDWAQVYYWVDRAEKGFNMLAAMQPMVEQYGTPNQRTHFFMALTANGFRGDRFAPSQTTRSYLGRARAAAAESLAAKDSPSTLFQLGMYSLFSGEPGPAEEYMNTALGKSQQTGDISLQARCLTYLAVGCRLQGRAEEVESWASRALEVARIAGMPEYMGTARANQAWLAWRQEDLDATESHGRAALALWAQLPIGHASAMFQWTALWPLLSAALQRDDIAAGLECARALLNPAQARQSREAEDRLERAVRAGEVNDPARARELLDQAVASARHSGCL